MKKIIALLTALFMCGSMAACGTGDNGGSSSQAGSSESVSSSSETSEVSSSVSEDSSEESSEEPEESAGPGGTINLYTWEGMFPQDILESFTDETGIEINYVNFDSDENMLSKLEAEKGGTYDVIIADDYIIETAIAQGLVGKLDMELLPNYENINPAYQSQFYDPNNEYTVPYGAGIQTIVYNPDMVEIEIKGYADLFDTSLEDSVGLIANSRVIDGIGLKLLGESYNTNSVPLIEEAGEKMLELAPNVRLIKDDNLQDDLLSGEVNAAVLYTSQATTAKLANPDLKVVFPEEGIGFGIMAGFIPVAAPNAGGAHAFLEYILRPDIAAQCFDFLGYYCTNKEADNLISEELKPLLTLPEDLNIDSMEMIENIDAEALEAHEKIWTTFKTACGE